MYNHREPATFFYETWDVKELEKLTNNATAHTWQSSWKEGPHSLRPEKLGYEIY